MRRVQLAVLCSAVSSTLWAGTEFPAQQGDQVKNGELIVRLKPGVSGAVIQNYIPGAQVIPVGRLNLHLVRTPSLAPGMSTRIASDALVDFVEPNRIRRTTLAAPSDPNYSQQWNLQTLQALQAWTAWPNFYRTASTLGQRVTVAVLDTGVDCTHPDFKNSGGTSTDSASGGQLLWSASQAPIQTTVAGAACPWQDDFGHGTHVAGTIAAATNNSLGVAGVGYQLQVMVFKVLDSTGSGDDVTISNAIMAATDAGAQVVSLSLGGAGYSQSLQTAVNYAWQHNVLVVAAAGNSASSGLFYPADANYAIAVSATDSSNNLASFSNFGQYIGLAAPGVNVLSTLPTYTSPIGGVNYGSLSGTSMATPHVSAVAGLVAMTTPGASAASIVQRMQQTASSITVGGGWNQSFGYGVVNAYNAVAGLFRTASNGGVRGQVVDSSGVPVTSATVTISGSSFTTDSTGLFTFGTFSAGTYPVTVSASGFPNQNLTVTIAPGASSNLTVTMGVSYGRFAGTVTDKSLAVPGAIVQAFSNGLIAGTAVTDANGQYSLWVPAGAYSIRGSGIGRSNANVAGQSVGGGGTTALNLVIPALGGIAGTVTNSSASPVANAQIAIVSASATLYETSDASGHYSTLGLPAGTYSVTCTASGLGTVTNGAVVVSVDAVTNQNCQFGGSSTSNTAAFVKTDTTTQGSWKGVYGANGYNVIADTTAYPSYVSVTPSGALSYLWTGNTTDTRALQRVSAANRIAGTWYNGGAFTIDLNFTDGATHQFALYCLDWDGAGARSERIDVMDGATVLDTRTVTNFAGGQYLVWKLGGHVTVRVTNTSAINGVVSGLFFDSGSSMPQAAAPVFNKPSGTYTAPFQVTITSAASVHYTTDGVTVPSSTVGTLYSGPINITGTTTLRAVAYGVGMTDSPVTSATYTIAAASTNTAAFVKTDTTTQGSWKGVYGANGYNVIDDTVAYPAYVTVTPSGASNYLWAGSTTDVRGLQKVSAANRIAGTWFNSGPFTIDLNFTDGATHQFALYCVDWDQNGARSERIDILNGSTVLDTRTVANFAGGQYLVWKLGGHVTIRVTNTSSINGVVSGLFFDTSSASSSANTATFSKIDTTTQGSWKGVYGVNGYNVIDDTAAYPSYVSVTPSGANDYVWTSSTADTRGLQKVSAADRIAGTWFNPNPFTIDLNFTDGATHQLALYCVDWDGGGVRAQRIDILDGTTVLDSRTISSFAGGQYLVWKLSGHVTIRVTNTSSINGVISGLFFDAAP